MYKISKFSTHKIKLECINKSYFKSMIKSAKSTIVILFDNLISN